MSIEEYFVNINNKKIEMETAYKNYIEHIQLKCSVSGIDFSKEIVSGSRKIIGLDSMIQDDEEYADEYKLKHQEYKQERERCLSDIKKLKEPLYRLIIEYSYINQETIKDLCLTLKNYHNKEYSVEYITKEKSKAKKKFEEVINHP